MVTCGADSGGLVVTCGEAGRAWRHRATNSFSRFVSLVFIFHCFLFLFFCTCFFVFFFCFFLIQYVYRYLCMCVCVCAIVRMGVGVNMCSVRTYLLALLCLQS